MSDTLDRLSRARSEMEAAHERLLKVEAAQLRAYLLPGGVAELIRATAAHSRALRELFLATLEAPAAEPPKPRASYVADGPAYRRLRAQMVARSMHSAVACIDRLEAFAGDEADVRIVAGLLTQFGERETAASLLRNVEG